MKNRKKIFWAWHFRGRYAAIACFILFGVIFAVTFVLYGFPMEAVLYPGLLCLGLGLAALGIDAARQMKRHDARVKLLQTPEPNPALLPDPISLPEAELTLLSQVLHRDYLNQRTAARTQETEAMEYFVTWVHQIKTPISAIGMLLQAEDSEQNRAISAELFRVEQYVDMVLNYFRLQGENSDYVFQEVDLNQVIRESIRKFAPQFVHKRIQVEYAGTTERALSDEKWLKFILEQLLSNAVKYTMKGKVSISVQRGIISVEDTGIGIAEEDLPRIFDMGFTGYNGRENQKATGLGLYLSQQAAQRIGGILMVISRAGEGTRVQLSLPREKLLVD